MHKGIALALLSGGILLIIFGINATESFNSEVSRFFTGNPTFPGDKADAIKGVTHIAITHGHDDHLGDTLDIAKQTGAKVIANYEICMWYAGQGLEKFDPMNFGGTLQQDGFSISMVRADHSSAHLEGSTIVYLGNPGGLIVKAPGEPTVYHMGDTDIFGDMALINELHQPEIGIVPIGDRFTMGGAVAALACRRFFNFKTVVPCHYASFGIIDQNSDKFVAGMEGSGVDVKVPPKGEAFSV